jgi:hypothetical protein
MATGAINWKLGGTPVAKSLRFVGDPYADFSGQHFARIIPNGTLTIFDNGTFVGRPPRAANYQISTATMTDPAERGHGPKRQLLGVLRKREPAAWRRLADLMGGQQSGDRANSQRQSRSDHHLPVRIDLSRAPRG